MFLFTFKHINYRQCRMFRPVFLFKVLILSIIVNFVFVVHFFLQTTHNTPYTDKADIHYEISDYYSVYDTRPQSTNIKIIPIPMHITIEHSKILLLNNFRLVPNQKTSKDLESALLRYSKYISLLTGLTVNIDKTSLSSSSENALIINCPSIQTKKNKYPKLHEDESYSLNVTKTGAYLNATTLTGVIRGLSTFIQLIERDSTSENNYIPLAAIFDRPRFPWRGLMLDVSRHWMPVPVIERTLNAMELSKLNVLHLHLSDDQGFRVESLQHPLLHDRQDYFTQKDIHHLVEFARQRRIRIVPEFDIPGHTTSWFVGYPDLATEPGPYVVETRWGVMQPTMDPTKESTYTFLDSFFQEMAALFPDPYFHIGGDEVEGSKWASSASIQKFITEHKLENKNGLQAYFNRRIQTMLKKHDKIMIGWEEILDEIGEKLAVDNDAIIQSWKSRKSLINAIDKGYRGILSHGFYLDHLVSSTTHYKVDPILDNELWLFNEQQLSRVLGGEACMWAEYVSDKTIDSRIWPRVIVIAERFWSPSFVNNPNLLYERLFRMNHLLDKVQTGVTHLSSYKSRLQDLILDSKLKVSLLHPLTILADVCEPGGFEQRAQTTRYSSIVPLTTFTDALQPESEFLWKLETLSSNDKKLREIFQTWSINHLRLRQLFDEIQVGKNRQLWGQDLEQLSKNLAQIGQIGLRILDYGAKRILHHDKNNTMNNWPLINWIAHHNQQLSQFENQVIEVRLAAVRPVQRLFKSLEMTIL